MSDLFYFLYYIILLFLTKVVFGYKDSVHISFLFSPFIPNLYVEYVGNAQFIFKSRFFIHPVHFLQSVCLRNNASNLHSCIWARHFAGMYQHKCMCAFVCLNKTEIHTIDQIWMILSYYDRIFQVIILFVKLFIY